LEVQDEGAFLANEIFRLVPFQKTSHSLPFLSSEINDHFDEVSRTLDLACFHYSSNSKVQLFEVFE